jgi:hypothetical protein
MQLARVDEGRYTSPSHQDFKSDTMTGSEALSVGIGLGVETIGFCLVLGSTKFKSMFFPYYPLLPPAHGVFLHTVLPQVRNGGGSPLATKTDSKLGNT